MYRFSIVAVAVFFMVAAASAVLWTTVVQVEETTIEQTFAKAKNDYLGKNIISASLRVHHCANTIPIRNLPLPTNLKRGNWYIQKQRNLQRHRKRPNAANILFLRWEKTQIPEQKKRHWLRSHVPWNWRCPEIL